MLYLTLGFLEWYESDDLHQAQIPYGHQGDLVIFPCAYHESPSLGVKYYAVRGGIFEERRNVPEAEVIVDAVLDHMQDRPNESLGVVALNFEQRELIEELLDRWTGQTSFKSAVRESCKFLQRR